MKGEVCDNIYMCSTVYMYMYVYQGVLGTSTILSLCTLHMYKCIQCINECALHKLLICLWFINSIMIFEIMNTFHLDCQTCNIAVHMYPCTCTFG